MEEASWRRRDGGGIMAETSWRRHHWSRHHGHLGSIWRYLGDICLEASGRHLEASGGVWRRLGASGGI